jgi:hypothetical protein
VVTQRRATEERRSRCFTDTIIALPGCKARAVEFALQAASGTGGTHAPDVW